MSSACKNSCSLEEFCAALDDLLREQKGAFEHEALFERGRALLSRLLANDLFLEPVLRRLIYDDEFLRSQWHSPDPNDITLYRSPSKSFSVHLFIWEPDVDYSIHDHGSWGIVGAYANDVEEVRYRRRDDGKVEGFADIEQVSATVLSPGSTTTVLPLNDGIHKMAAVDRARGPAITIHVYGAAIRKGYIQVFNIQRKTVRKAYPPTTQKRILAIKATASLDRAWARATLADAMNENALPYIKEECLAALGKAASSSGATCSGTRRRHD